ncbi:MAG: translocation/assembly module TamB domain-containing protein [Bacteroidetes bacterium]|nr:translocation/assembly module TamB domain-containing protein [Bacteroidota bacterium]
MRKTLRIIFKIFSVMVLFVITFPLVLSMVVKLDFVQDWLISKCTDFASEKINTTLTIGEISVDSGLGFNISDFYLKDPDRQDTLLYVENLSARITSLPIHSKKLVFDDAVLTNAKLFLENDSDSILNLKRVIDKLKSNKEKSNDPLTILINDVKLNGVDFRFKQYKYRSVEAGINYQNMRFNGITGKVSKLSIISDSITMKVKNFAFVETSNIRGHHINISKMTLTPRVMSFEKGNVGVDSSFLDFNMVKMSYHDWDMSDYIYKVPMYIDIKKSDVSMATVAKFTGKPQEWTMDIKFSGTYTGTVNNTKGIVRYAEVGDTYINNATYTMKGIPDIDNTIFDINVPELQTSIKGIQYIVNDFSPKDIPLIDSSAIKINNLIYGNASFVGKIKDFKAKTSLSPDLEKTMGELKVDGHMQMMNDYYSIEGDVDMQSLSLPYFIKNSQLGNITSNFKMFGELLEKPAFFVGGEIEKLYFNKYNYKDIKVSIDYEEDNLNCSASSDDENFDLSFVGDCNFASDLLRYNVDVDIKHLDLVKLNINKKDSASVLRGTANLNLSGLELSKLVGGIIIDSVEYIVNRDTLKTLNIIRANFNNTIKSNHVSIKSDFADIEFKGVMGYDNLYGYLVESLRKFLPSFQSEKIEVLKKSKRRKGEKLIDYDNFYMIKVDIKKSNVLTSVVVPGLVVADGTQLSLIFNPFDDILSMRINSEGISYNDIYAEGLIMDFHNDNGALSLFARVDAFEAGGIFIPNAMLVGEIKDDVIDLSGRFTNKADSSEALIKTRSVLSRVDGKENLKINVKPSYLKMKNKTWSTNDSYININKDKISFDHINIFNESQRFNINGVISESLDESLDVEFNNFNVETARFIFQHFGYDISGFVTGKATGYALKSKEKRRFNSHIQFDDFNVNGISLASSVFDSWWEDDKKSIVYTLKNSKNLFIDGYVIPQKQYYYAKVDIPDLDVALASPFMKTIVVDIDGKADVDVTLSNPNGYFAVDGEVDVKSFLATVLFTNARYEITGKAIIKDNQYTLQDGLVTDEFGEKAPVTAFMINTKYKKVKYNFDIHPKDLLVLNLTERQNDIFYGKAFATGRVTIDGDRNNVLMSIDATTAKESTFFLPLNKKVMLSDANYITFAEKEDSDFKKRSFFRKKKEETELNTSFAIALNLNVKKNLEAEIVVDPITGSSIKTKGEGKIFIYVVPKDGTFSMSGDYVIDQGTYLFILPNFNLVNKFFSIKRGGWIKWSGDPLDARIGVDAIYNLKASLAPLFPGDKTNKYNSRVAVECVLSLKNKLLEPDIKLGIEVPGANPETQSRLRSILSTEEDISTQLFFLLFSNTFYATETNSGVLSDVGVATGIEFFTSQINELISSENFDLVFNYRPRGDQTSNEVELNISAPILKDKLFIDVEGSYNFMDNEVSKASENMTNLSGDFYLTWVLDSTGDIQLKGFSRTIDTFDENQGLQESGVGVYYKAEFNKFRDLIAKYRKFWIERPERRQDRKDKRKKKKQQKKDSKNN